MNTDFSNVAWRSSACIPPPAQLEYRLQEFNGGVRRVTEAYKGTAIVGWQGRIERQLQDFVSENTEARNYEYADKLRAFLELWRQNSLNGSLNVETIETLLAATQVSAVDTWRYQGYFSNLRDQLRKLKASVEELPLTDRVDPSMRGPSSSPPSSFGPSESPPAGGEGVAAADELTGEAPEGETEEIPGT